MKPKSSYTCHSFFEDETGFLNSLKLESKADKGKGGDTEIVEDDFEDHLDGAAQSPNKAKAGAAHSLACPAASSSPQLPGKKAPQMDAKAIQSKLAQLKALTMVM